MTIAMPSRSTQSRMACIFALAVPLIVRGSVAYADDQCVPCEYYDDAYGLSSGGLPCEYLSVFGGYFTCYPPSPCTCIDEYLPIHTAIACIRFDHVYEDELAAAIVAQCPETPYPPSQSAQYVYVGDPFLLCAGGVDADSPCGGTIYTDVSIDGGEWCVLDFPEDPSYCDHTIYRVLGLSPFTVSTTTDDSDSGACDDPPQTCDATITPLCGGPERAIIAPGVLCADGQSITYAAARHYREIEWSIVGPSLGCTLETCPFDPAPPYYNSCWNPGWECLFDPGSYSEMEWPRDWYTPPQHVRVRAGVEEGHITLRAADKYFSDCYVDYLVAIGCHTCVSGECGPGTEHIELENDLLIKLDLGADDRGDARGFFYFQADKFDDALPTPRFLRYTGGLGLLLIAYETLPLPSLIEDAGEYLGNMASDYQYIDCVGNADYGMWADVVYESPDDTMFEIHLRNAGENVSVPPFSSWLIDGTNRTNSQFRIENWTEGYPNSGGTLQHAHRFLYQENGSDSSTWEVRKESASGAVLSKRIVFRTTTSSNATHEVSTYETIDGESELVSESSEIWTTYSWGRERTAEHRSTGTGTQIYTWDYYDQPGGPVNRLKYETMPDGSWRWLTYYSDGRVHTEMTLWKDSSITPPTPPNPISCREITYTYDVSTGSTGTGNIASITERILGTIVRLTKYSYGDDGNDHPVTIENQCINPDADAQDQVFLTTTTVYWDKERKRLKLIQHPGEQVDSYTDPETAPGTFSIDVNGNAEFISGSGNDRRYSIEHAFPNPVSQKSTKDVIVIDEAGRRVWEETFVYVGSGYDSEPIKSVVRKYNSQGKLEQVWHANNTTTVYVHGCCGVDSVTDQLGVTTSYVRDGLGRTIQETKEGIGAPQDPGFQDTQVTETDYSEDGNPRIRRVTRRDGASTISLYSVEEFDWVDRVIRSVDEAGLETSYEYALSTSGGRLVTVTEPSGAIVETEYYRDGRLRKESRSGIVERYHDYGVNADGTQWTKIYKGPSGYTSLRWTKRTTDPLGRAVSEERPAYSSSEPIVTLYSYDDSSAGGGRLRNTQSFHDGEPLSAALAYEYDEVGAIRRTGIDLDESSDSDGDLNQLATSGILDRISQVDANYVKVSSNWWRETAQKVYVDGTATPVTVGKSRERLTFVGLASSTISVTELIDSYGEVTRIATTLDVASKRVTETTTFPATGNTAIRITQNGLILSETDKAQLTTSYEYDGLGRTARITDSRHNSTETEYSAVTGQVTRVRNAHNDETTYTYYGTGQMGAGQIQSVTNALGNATCFDYDSWSRIVHTLGDVPQPTWIEYGDFGERVKLHTYGVDPTNGTWSGSTWPSTVGDGNTTTWQYDESTGLLKHKLYKLGENYVGPSYIYTADGKLQTRVWVRDVPDSNPAVPLTTTYSYSTGATGTGELISVDYNDLTADVGFTYNRTGQLASVSDSASPAPNPRTFLYDARLQRFNEAFPSSSIYGQRTIRTNYTDSVPYTASGGLPTIHKFVRLGQVGFGPPSTPTSEYNATYDYNGNTDWMNKVTGPGLPSGGAVYKYLGEPGSASTQPASLVERIQFRDGATTRVEAIRTYEPSRDLLLSVENKMTAISGSPTISKYAYVNDALARRTSCVRTGTAFSGTDGASPDPHHDDWTYNDRNELTGSKRFNNGTPSSQPSSDAVPTLDRGYAYDPVGNRRHFDEGTSPRLHYCANELNQYEATDDTGPDQGCPSAIETFSYDPDGNLTVSNSFGTIAPGAPPRPVVYAWDAENRLTSVIPSSVTNGDQKVEFKYDYMGRRVEKAVFEWDSSLNGGAGGWETPTVTRFMWHNWLTIAEMDGASTPALNKRYVWGLDLAGQGGVINSMEEAGGIGGLLSVYDYDNGNPDLKHVYCYDANGNVTQLADAAASTMGAALLASYEYDSYGALIASGGFYNTRNAFRVSTKFTDDELDVAYFGLRHYLSHLGSWMSRDPIGENDDVHLYRFVSNEPNSNIDALGLELIHVEFNAFIHKALGKWVKEPPIFPGLTYSFATDNRDFGGGSAKIKSVVTIESSTIGNCCKTKPLVTVNTTNGVSRQQHFDRTGRSWATSRKGDLVQKTKIFNYCYRRVCFTQVTIDASAGYPYTEPLSPNIDYSIIWQFSVPAKDSVTAEVWGSHNLFPWYEALMHGPVKDTLYQFSPPQWAASGPGLVNLNSAELFHAKGLSVSAKTPPCCGK